MGAGGGISVVWLVAEIKENSMLSMATAILVTQKSVTFRYIKVYERRKFCIRCVDVLFSE